MLDTLLWFAKGHRYVEQVVRRHNYHNNFYGGFSFSIAVLTIQA